MGEARQKASEEGAEEDGQWEDLEREKARGCEEAAGGGRLGSVRVGIVVSASGGPTSTARPTCRTRKGSTPPSSRPCAHSKAAAAAAAELARLEKDAEATREGEEKREGASNAKRAKRKEKDRKPPTRGARLVQPVRRAWEVATFSRRGGGRRRRGGRPGNGTNRPRRRPGFDPRRRGGRRAARRERETRTRKRRGVKNLGASAIDAEPPRRRGRRRRGLPAPRSRDRWCLGVEREEAEEAAQAREASRCSLVSGKAREKPFFCQNARVAFSRSPRDVVVFEGAFVQNVRLDGDDAETRDSPPTVNSETAKLLERLVEIDDACFPSDAGSRGARTGVVAEAAARRATGRGVR